MDYVIIALLLVVIALQIIKMTQKKDNQEFDSLKKELNENVERTQKYTVDFLQKQLELQATGQNNLLKQISENTQSSLDTLRKTVNENSQAQDKRFDTFQKSNETKLNQIRDTLETKVSELQTSNEKKLEQMRETVDEKLQKTLEDRISQSFKLVSERLEQVYKSLGEMQKLGEGVTDLKKVLSNVKTRGILGEVQLGAILEQILNQDQYVSNVATKKGSNDRVEFAVKLPGEDDEFVYLPIDAKFPMDAYQNLLDAYDTGVQTEVEASAKVLMTRIKSFAKDISTKYLDVPNTTDFGIMFLPIEGLYAEVVRRGMIEILQKEKIIIAGPTTMSALLNSLQMGFKTLAIQKRSGEVWAVLEGVKQEFSKFGDALTKTQQRMRQASDELDKLVTTRTNAINRKLRDVSTIEISENIEE